MSLTIYVRERRKVEKGEKKPRFRVVGVSGDLKLYVDHIRKRELEEIADNSGAKVVFLKTSKKDDNN
ncbi:conserved hypothetical protein [Candidatus Magnetomoraceae bacterium gMMP-15]